MYFNPQIVNSSSTNDQLDEIGTDSMMGTIESLFDHSIHENFPKFQVRCIFTCNLR